MRQIIYSITFFSYWHCGSGLSGGAENDGLVIKDNKLPYIPGKTIKGLLRESATELYKNDTAFLNQYFGEADSISGCSFNNAALTKKMADHFKENPNDIGKLYSELSMIRIDEVSGIAKDQMLRKIETTIPITLVASIDDVPNNIKHIKMIHNCMRMTKRLGLDRNRGLGRCIFEIVEGGVQ